jgi:hypothetical protein
VFDRDFSNDAYNKMFSKGQHRGDSHTKEEAISLHGGSLMPTKEVDQATVDTELEQNLEIEDANDTAAIVNLILDMELTQKEEMASKNPILIEAKRENENIKAENEELKIKMKHLEEKIKARETAKNDRILSSSDTFMANQRRKQFQQRNKVLSLANSDLLEFKIKEYRASLVKICNQNEFLNDKLVKTKINSTLGSYRNSGLTNDININKKHTNNDNVMQNLVKNKTEVQLESNYPKMIQMDQKAVANNQTNQSKKESYDVQTQTSLCDDEGPKCHNVLKESNDDLQTQRLVCVWTS